VGLDLLVTGIRGSNAIQGIDLCACLSVLCCPLLTGALKRADAPSKKSYQASNNEVRKPQEEAAYVMKETRERKKVKWHKEK